MRSTPPSHTWIRIFALPGLVDGEEDLHRAIEKSPCTNQLHGSVPPSDVPETCTYFAIGVEFGPTLRRQLNDATRKGQEGPPEALQRPPGRHRGCGQGSA